MKKIVLIAFLISTGLFAQRPNGEGQRGNHEKIKALKTAHITEQLNLTSSEAEKFWPVYNEFDNKLMALREKERNEVMGKLRNGGTDSLTDKEANTVIDKMLVMKTSELEYRKELVANLRAVLPPKKIIKLQRAEESFKRLLLERLKEHRGKK